MMNRSVMLTPRQGANGQNHKFMTPFGATYAHIRIQVEITPADLFYGVFLTRGYFGGVRGKTDHQALSPT